ncbi:uncharacterized protein EV154DRAFT_479216 [Mucor mucedo]|uniref:uncharacterized protein n=1 Tax=Mucor mucedo TaxID=29922 RepID=UPI002220C3FA|nr:uncharacterized protein EV154DRAFT_479216 [Mucor mucedo]KAI7893465.1 hypothetical protein EV154DRAFT_479216 [Mucor mucedo]
MTPLTRWFNRPRKNSSPTRLALSEFMNISSSQQQKFTFPSNRHESSQSSSSRTPMLITSSFYNREYPFDTHESITDEDNDEEKEVISRPITPDLQPPQYQTIYNQQTSYAPTQLMDIPQQPSYNHTQHYHSNSMPPLTQYHVDYMQMPPPESTEYINIPSQTEYINIPQQTQYLSHQPSISREDVFQSHERPRQSRYRSTQERVPTPYVNNQRYSDEEDDQQVNGKRFSADDIARFEKLKDDFKKLEKKHKRKEQRVQELEYLLSKSLESQVLNQHLYYYRLEENRLRDYYIQQQKWTHTNDVRKNRPF